MMSAVAIKPITLRTLLAGIVRLPRDADRAVKGLCLDSRVVREGDVFIALRSLSDVGRAADAFIDAAIAAGATAVLWQSETDLPAVELGWRVAATGEKIPLIAVAGLDVKLGLIADRFSAEPSNYLSITGITGTNGKTSISHYLAQCLAADGRCGVLGTLGAGILKAGAAETELQQTGHTTPDALRVHQWLAEMRAQAVSEISMEVSSHALAQGRVNGIRFDCAVFSNLSREHLDYHGDMETYAEVKAGLFSMPDLKRAVINVDDTYGRELAAGLAQRDELSIIRYGLQEQAQVDVLGQDLSLDAQGLSMQVVSPWGSASLRVPLLGRFNASNVLAVLALLGQKGLPLKQIIARLQKLKPVAGRMQCLGGGQQPLVVVDYAHTPDALEQALLAVREHTRGQCWCVFGCGGERDQGKRALMGEVAARLADKIILTNDNPRREAPEKILSDIQQGMAADKVFTVEADRATAIALAIAQIDAGDVLLIAGKGHEDYQIIGADKRPFSDVGEAKKQLLKKVGEA
ncbi:UDP-N-acetylmuramoylalanyl-D-glutamate--2,6-diaminopimelate ligase [hydrothermal vent metagenome]|uniref:UDP-N-acetylmuramoylalanyl-D-glutamate--2,6-diaminopimelate ligase n=1 Tax=hydrothermal vent metagenome TaxID=652676 RepID=A0A3B1C4X1_9ZZZZ